MSRLARFVIGMVVIEAFLAGLWWYLMTLPGQKPEAPMVIGQVMGGAMGLVLGFGVFLFVVTLVAQKKR